MGKQTKPKKETQSRDLYVELAKKIEAAANSTTAWSKKQEKWHALRMRIKKPKTFPFPNCSNIRIPTAEIKIRKQKAALLNGVLGIRPVVQVIPSPGGSWVTAAKIEKFLDHLIMDIMKLKPKANIAIDQMLEKGMYLLQPYWKVECNKRTETINLDDFSVEEVMSFLDPDLSEDDQVEALASVLDVDKSDRVWAKNEKALKEAVGKLTSGESKVDVMLDDVIYDFPDVALISPERCYVPTDSGFDVQGCELVCVEKFIPLREVKQNAEEDGKGWDKQAIDDIEAVAEIGAKKLTDALKDLREGIDRINNPSQQLKIWEIQGWYDLDKDGVPEKVLITLAPEFKKTLRAIALPWFSGRYNLVKIFYELIDDRWFSHRGIVEICEDIIKEIDIQHMQKIDRQTIANSGMFVYRAGMVNPNLVQFQLNQAIPVHGMQPLDDTIKAINLQNPNIDYSYEREEQILSGRIEELIGQVDFNLQSMINKRQPRTLGEVNLQFQSTQAIANLDLDMLSCQFADLFNWIWDLWSQFGSDEYEFSYFGKDGYEPIKLTKEETQGKWKITVRGNDQNTNPQTRLQKAQMILQAQESPVLLQTGVITPQHLANGLKRFYQELEIPNWEELGNFSGQVVPPQQPTVQPIQPQFDQLTDAEKAQILQKQGVSPDIQGRMLEKMHTLSETQIKAGGSGGRNGKSQAKP